MNLSISLERSSQLQKMYKKKAKPKNTPKHVPFRKRMLSLKAVICA